MLPAIEPEGKEDGAGRLGCRPRAGTGWRQWVRLGETTVAGFLMQARIG